MKEVQFSTGSTWRGVGREGTAYLWWLIPWRGTWMQVALIRCPKTYWLTSEHEYCLLSLLWTVAKPMKSLQWQTILYLNGLVNSQFCTTVMFLKVNGCGCKVLVLISMLYKSFSWVAKGRDPELHCESPRNGTTTVSALFRVGQLKCSLSPLQCTSNLEKLVGFMWGKFN